MTTWPTRRLPILAFVAAVLAVHLLTLFLLRERSLPFSYLIAGLAYAPAIALTLREPYSKAMRLRSRLWIASLAFEMLELLSAAVHSSVWFYLPSLFQVVSFSLCLLVVATPPLPRKSRWVEFIDILLAVTVCILSAIAFLLPHPTLPDDQWLALLTLIRLVPAVAALLSMRIAATPEKQRLFRFIAIYQSADFVSTFLLNQVMGTWLNLPRATFLDFFLEAPILLLVVLLASPPAPTVPARGKNRFVVRSGLPLFLALTVIAFGFWLLPRSPLAGCIGIAVAILGYALRSTLTQGRVLETEEQLRQSVAQLEDLANRDPLTNVYNRRAFDQTIRRYWPLATPASPLSLIFMDLDLFKQINDSMGHLYGDRCLRAIAAVLEDASKAHLAEALAELQSGLAPPAAYVCRFGGDEFAIILPNTRPQDAAALADRICVATRALALRTPLNTPLSVSVGVAASSPVDGHTIASLIAEADANLNQAKRAGRNRVQRSPDKIPLDDDQLHTLVLRVAELALRAPLPPR